MKILSFDAWLTLNPQLVAEIEELARQDRECYACGGTGEEECSECGNVRLCLSCNGTGYEDEDHIGNPHSYLKKMYTHGVEIELARIAQWGVSVGEREAINEIPRLEIRTVP